MQLRLVLILMLAFAGIGRAAVKDPKVVLVVIDGVRALEWQGRAKDDDGRVVSAASLMPNLMRLRKKGVFLPEMRISNPAGISLPAYADIFAGRRQEKIVDNGPEEADFHSHYPTLFEALPDAAIVSSWQPLCRMAVQREDAQANQIFRSCGWEKGTTWKPEVYEGSRVDSDTMLIFKKEIPKRHPRFVFVHLGDADEEAHLHKEIQKRGQGPYGIFFYHQALRQDDFILGEIQKTLESDSFYRGSTYLVVTTDHGRDDVPHPLQWADHGACLKHQDHLCDGCRHVFGLAVGPGLRPKVVSRNYTHVDLAPTIARWMNVAFPSATGNAIPELHVP